MADKRGQNEGNIYRRADGRWTARVRIGIVAGKHRRVCVYGKTRNEVAKKLRAVITAHEQGMASIPARMTLGQFMQRWLTDSVEPKVRPRTLSSYEQMLRTHITPGLGHVPLQRLGPQHVQAWLNERARSGLSPRTCQYARAILRAALTQAVRWGYVPRNVAALVDAPRATRAEIKPLSPDQARALIASAQRDRKGALVTVALALGLRQGEILGLRWRDLELDNAMLSVRHALQWLPGKGWQLVEPKSERSRRSISLPDVAAKALRLHRQKQLEDRLLAGPRWTEHDFVFTTRTGTPLDPWNVSKAFKRLLKSAALPNIRFHDLRHTAATLLLSQGVDPRTIMETLGHSQISLTLNTYSHVLPSMQRGAAEKMDRLLVG